MTLKILGIRPDKSVFITTAISKEKLEKSRGREISDKEYEEKIWSDVKKSHFGGVEFRQLNDNDIPSDREFRDAWEDSQKGPQIDVCCTKAKAIALSKLRAERNEELTKTDPDYMKALELDKDVTTIKAKRQKLRDATEPLKAIDTDGQFSNTSVLETLSSLSKLDNVLKNTE